MKIYSSAETAIHLPYSRLIKTIAGLYRSGLSAPARAHHTMVNNKDQSDSTLLLMPAWGTEYGCVKIVTVTPDNNVHGLPSIAGSVLVFERATGTHIAILDGAVLTVRRTVAASALAARYLSRADSEHLLLVGAGKIAEQMPAAMASVRPIKTVRIWNHNPTKAHTLTEELCRQGFDACAITDLKSGIKNADIISCATLSQRSLIQGRWLQEGQHLDLVGAFTPTMREADDTALQRAAVYVDTQVALSESGEMAIPLANGTITPADILGDFYSLCVDDASKRTDPQHITLFKSVGNAVLDLAAAQTVISS